MKTAQKPWSQLDDEPIAESPLSEQTASQVDHAIPAAAPEKDWRRRLNDAIAAIGGIPIVLTGASICWAAIAFAVCDRQSSFLKWHVFAVMLLNFSGLLAFACARRKSVDADISANEISPVVTAPVPSGAMWQNIQQHTKNIETRVAELLDERKQIHLEASLATSQKKQIESILNSVSDPLLVTDRFDQIVFVNAAAIELLHLGKKEIQRHSIEGVLSDEKLVRYIRQAREADTRAAKRKLEHDIAGKAYALSITPFVDSVGNSGAGPAAHGVITIFRDITREREASKAKSEFVAHVSHELRTPLSSIRAYMEMLVDGEAADEKTRAEYYEIIQTSAERLGRLIDNMLNISRIEAGTVRINKEPVAISMIVKEVTDSLRPQAEEKKIALVAELAPVVDQIMADRDLMYQAVLNLVSNAVKYTPNGGQVLVRMFSQDESHSIRIEVTDTGVGIPAEDLPRVFEKFYRVEANKQMAKGTGLGLNLVKNIVEVVHEGKLSLDSTVGKGSTFAITLSKVQ